MKSENFCSNLNLIVNAFKSNIRHEPGRSRAEGLGAAHRLGGGVRGYQDKHHELNEEQVAIPCSIFNREAPRKNLSVRVSELALYIGKLTEFVNVESLMTLLETTEFGTPIRDPKRATLLETTEFGTPIRDPKRAIQA